MTGKSRRFSGHYQGVGISILPAILFSAWVPQAAPSGQARGAEAQSAQGGRAGSWVQPRPAQEARQAARPAACWVALYSLTAEVLERVNYTQYFWCFLVYIDSLICNS